MLCRISSLTLFSLVLCKTFVIFRAAIEKSRDCINILWIVTISGVSPVWRSGTKAEAREQLSLLIAKRVGSEVFLHFYLETTYVGTLLHNVSVWGDWGGDKGVWHWEGLALLIGEMVCSEFFELLYGNSMFCAGFSYEAFVWIFERAKNVKLSVHA